MSTALAIRTTQPTATRADTDRQLIRIWLFGKAAGTQKGYARDVERFLAFTGCGLSDLCLEDVQAYAESLSDLSPATQARKLAAVKSLLSFGHEVGYLRFNVGKAIKLPKREDTLAERILPEAEVQAMIHAAKNRRNRVLLRLMYASGARVSELARLRWRHVQENRDAGQVTLYGKGSKTRTVFLSPETWKELRSLRNGHADGDPVFESRQGGPLKRGMIWNVVRTAAERAGIQKDVSPHWLRHAHASHSLDRGAPVHLVKQTLGHASLATTSQYAHARPGDSSARYLAV